MISTAFDEETMMAVINNRTSQNEDSVFEFFRKQTRHSTVRFAC